MPLHDAAMLPKGLGPDYSLGSILPEGSERMPTRVFYFEKRPRATMKLIRKLIPERRRAEPTTVAPMVAPFHNTGSAIVHKRLKSLAIMSISRYSADVST